MEFTTTTTTQSSSYRDDAPLRSHPSGRLPALWAVTMAPPTARRTPYKDFLQPALHRRFSSTATILLIVAYLEAVFLDEWKSCELHC